ncbi:MAG: hypothetical protein AAGI07_18640 [Bacteroidota bacterium]
MQLLKVLILFVIFYCPSVVAKTHVVDKHKTGKNTFASIKTAVSKVETGDTIFINPGIYTETNIILKEDIVIIGYDKTKVILQASSISNVDAGRIFKIEAATNIEIQNLTLSNGATKDFGGAIYTLGNIKLDNVIIKDCYAGASGGGIAVVNSFCEIVNTEITNNYSKNDGGGIYLSGSNMKIMESVIYKNQATFHGGGIKSDNSALNADNTFIVENTAKKGGGIYTHLSGASFFNVDFQENGSDTTQGGSLYIFTLFEDASVIINRCRIGDNLAKNDIVQEAYNSKNYIFIEKTMYNKNKINKNKKSNGDCKVFYDGKDIFHLEPTISKKED